MKRVIIFIICSSIVFHSQAQISDHHLYDMPNYNSLMKQHQFYNSDGTSVTLNFYSYDQLDTLLQMENLVHKVWLEVRPVVEKMNNTYSKRFDYTYFSDSSKLRVKEHNERGDGYVLANGKFVDSKIGLDTFRIIIQNFVRKDKDENKYYQPLYLTLTFKKIEDMALFDKNKLINAIDAAKMSAPKKPSSSDLNVKKTYNWVDNNWKSHEIVQKKNKKKYFEPDFYVGFQYVRGFWVPSTAIGIQFISGNYFGEREAFKLLWEPHFYFSRDDANTFLNRRNDFVTFRYDSYYKKSLDSKVNTTSSLSIGYLVGRSGDLYEAQTFKFSLPGLAYEGLSVEPEFFFNDFFKNFSPSLKINYNID